MSDSFCGSCGANLEQFRHEQAARCEAMLNEVAEFERQGEYSQALRLLATLARSDDVHLRGFRDRAVAWVSRLEPAMREALAAAEHACRQAAEHLQQRDFPAALAVLETVPPGLRHEQTQQLLQHARAGDDEVRCLYERVVQAARTGRLTELGVQLDRLLALQPEHPKARRLARQLHDRQLQVAREQLAACSYGRALAELNTVPSAARSRELEKLSAECAELEWLAADVESAAYADATLEGVAERLVKLRPDDTAAARTLVRIRKARVQPPRDPRLAAPDWTPPRSRLLDLPVDQWAFPRRFAVSLQAASQLRHCPGRFWVALGLALQGIDRAAVALNFAPPQGKGILQRFSRRTQTISWGIDLGENSLKAVQLARGRDDSVALEQAVLIEYAADRGRGDETTSRTAALAALRGFLQQHSSGQERLCLSLAGSTVLGRSFCLPAIDSKRLKTAIAIEARQQLPVAPEELVWDYHVLPRPAEPTGEAGWQVLLHAAKPQHVQAMIELVREAGGRADVLTSNSLALHNAAVWELLEPSNAALGPLPAVAVLDVGRRGADLVISSQRSVWTRHIGIGGDALNTALVRDLQLTHAQSELLKRSPLRATRLSRLYGVLNPLLERLVGEVHRCLHLHGRQFPEVTVSRLFGCGGGCELHGLIRHLRNGTPTPVPQAAQRVHSGDSGCRG